MNPYAIIAALVMWAASLVGVGYWQHQQGAQGVIVKQQAKEIADQHALDSDRHLQRQAIDVADTRHQAALVTIQTQLGAAHAEIENLSGRPCLGSHTVGVLNAIGGSEPVRAPAAEPAGAPEAFATDRDVGEGLATCRAGYASLSSQVNQILDIEDQRHPPK